MNPQLELRPKIPWVGFPSPTWGWGRYNLPRMIPPATLGFALAFAPVIAAPAPASADFDFRDGEASPAAQPWCGDRKDQGGWVG